MVRRKMMTGEASLGPPASLDDFAIYVTARLGHDGLFYGDLLVSRKTDGRRLFPFDGAPEFGPFASVEEARRVAAGYGAAIAVADLKCPEP